MTKRIMIVRKDKCNPQGCGGYLCMRVSPSNRAGKEAIVKDDDGKVKVNEDLITEADRIAANKCPFDALEMINLPEELESEPMHRYPPNGFALYKLPIPSFNNVVGIIGRNGIGKSTALKIIGGTLHPNFGSDEPKTFEDLAEKYKGTEAQRFFEELADGNIRTSYKPQHVDLIPKQFNGSVEELLRGVDERDAFEEVVDVLALRKVVSRDIEHLSGGELQRVAIAASVLKDAELYLFDEPTSYLDVKQRINVSKFIKSLPDEDTAAIAIEHDLIVLDYLTDLVHIMYGEQGGYGVTSRGKTSKAGINVYLEGYIPEQNMRFRNQKISFEKRSANRRSDKKELVSWNAFTHSFDEFSLDVDAGTIHKNDVVGVLGENGIGKTTLVKVLSGEYENDEVGFDERLDVAYKPQYVEAPDELVASYLGDVSKYTASIIQPLEVKQLLTRNMQNLSGGELQRVELAKCLTTDADIYLLDEPSAYLDVEQRLQAAKVIRDVMTQRGKAAIVIDHDIVLLDTISTKLMVFTGEPSIHGDARGPFEMEDGMNMFLEELGITFRRDEENYRPRINKPGSQKDREQKRNGNYYYT